MTQFNPNNIETIKACQSISILNYPVFSCHRV